MIPMGIFPLYPSFFLWSTLHFHKCLLLAKRSFHSLNEVSGPCGIKIMDHFLIHLYVMIKSLLLYKVEVCCFNRVVNLQIIFDILFHAIVTTNLLYLLELNSCEPYYKNFVKQYCPNFTRYHVITMR